MSEFKGTKEEWKLDYPFIYADDYFQTHICKISDCYDDQISKSNALLISKAHEMLSLLKEICKNIENENIIIKQNTYDDYYFYDDAIKLIKQATEL